MMGFCVAGSAPETGAQRRRQPLRNNIKQVVVQCKLSPPIRSSLQKRATDTSGADKAERTAVTAGHPGPSWPQRHVQTRQALKVQRLSMRCGTLGSARPGG